MRHRRARGAEQGDQSGDSGDEPDPYTPDRCLLVDEIVHVSLVDEVMIKSVAVTFAYSGAVRRFRRTGLQTFQHGCGPGFQFVAIDNAMSREDVLEGV